MPGELLRKNSWDARPGRPRRAARTGLFIVAGGASSSMIDSLGKSLSGTESRAARERPPLQVVSFFQAATAAMDDCKRSARLEPGRRWNRQKPHCNDSELSIPPGFNPLALAGAICRPLGS